MSTPYAEHAFDYHRNGWRGVLPLPSNAKAPVPAGYTGRAGAWPSPADIQTFIDHDPHLGNIALRLPEDVIGLDVDMYDGKQGAVTIARLETELGPLPPTVMSTSRADGSGIRLFKVPPRPTWRDPGPGVEVIHYGWRYLVVWPSIHPEGRTYVWVDQVTGEAIEAPINGNPWVMTELPETWVERLSSDEHIDKASVTDPEVVAWLDALPDGPPCKATTNALDDFTSRLADAVDGGSRHDAVLRPSARLVRVGDLGHRGVRDALSVARQRFLDAATQPPRERAPGEAAAEWRRMIAGAVAIVKADPTPDHKRRCCGPTLAALPPPPSEPTADGEPDEPTERSSWDAIDPTGLLDGTYRPPQPAQLVIDDDGSGLLYPNATNAVYGESESGKSWVALWATVQALKRGETVVYLDFEADAPVVYDRLLKLGAPLDALRDRLAYVRPDTPLGGIEASVLAGVLDRYRPTLVVLDGITDAMGLHGLNMLDNADVQKFDKLLPRAIADRGPAVVQIDHLSQMAAKDPTSKYGLGAQHKRAAISGAAYRLDVVRQFAPGVHGYGKLTITKDRHGVIRGRNHATKIAAEFHLDATDPDDLTAELRRPEDNTDEQGEFRPTVLMQRVSMALEQAPDGLTTNKLKKAVVGKDQFVKVAIDKLIGEGFITTGTGPRNATVHRSVRPFTSAEAGAQKPAASSDRGPASGNQSNGPTEAPSPTEAHGREPVPGLGGDTDSEAPRPPVYRYRASGLGQSGQSEPPSTNGQRDATPGAACICPCHRGAGDHGGHPCPGCDRLEATA